MYIAVLARRLRPGKSYDDFIDAWYPDKGFGFAGRGPVVARGVADEQEIITVGYVDLPDGASLDEAMQRVGAQEAVRHDRIEAVIESTSLRGIYEIVDEFDFSTDETVAAGRPATRG
jgi:hypothetical protein